MENIVKINDKKLEKYQDLFFWAGKVAGRLFAQNKGTHRNLIMAVSNFEKHYANPEFGFFNLEHQITPLASVVELIIDDIIDEWSLYMTCRKFFYDVVFDVAQKEKINIEYNWITGEHALYGCNMNREKIDEDYDEYLNYLMQNNYQKTDIDSSRVIVDIEDYIY